MSRFRTLTNLIADVRQRTNQENSTFVTDAEITEYLNQAIAELETRLTLSQGQPHFRASAPYDVAPPTTLYPLPATFLGVQEVSIVINGATMSLTPFMANERAALVSSAAWPIFDGIHYRVQAGNIEFLPVVTSFAATLFYTPSQTRLVSGGDAWDGFNGYEVAAIYDTCAQVLAKEESDPSFFERQRDRIYQQIERAAAHRDMSAPERVQDVTGSSVPNAFGWWFR